MAEAKLLRVGEAARAAGLTVRALHHYDEAGLVRPSARTGAGHRLYAERELVRLERVAALRRVGLTLEEVAAVMDEGDVRTVLVRRLAQIDQDLAAASRQRAQLERAIEEMDMIEDKLRRRREAVGDDRISEVEREWAELFAALEKHRENETDPGNPAVRALAERGDALFAEFHGGDPELVAHAGRAWRERDPADASRGMVGAELWEYYGAAQAARRQG